jgi:hypothetical protein
MRTLVLLGWLMVPVVFGAYHYGPGQEKLRLDDVSQVLAQADRLAAGDQWQAASSKYEEALTMLPEGRAGDARRIRLQRAKVQMLGNQLPEANTALLAEEAEAAGHPESARKHREDLESSIRLARLELAELQGLDLPKQCSNCKSGQCKNPGKKPGGKKPGQKKEEEKKDSRSAGAGPPPDNSGS